MNESDIVALVAFIISLVALVLAFIQFLQATFLTAEGSRKCKPAVIGKWARFVRWERVWSELRYEIIFTTPRLKLVNTSNVKTVSREDEETWTQGFGMLDDGNTDVTYVHAADTGLRVFDPSDRLPHIIGYNSLPYNVEQLWQQNVQTLGERLYFHWRWATCRYSGLLKPVESLPEAQISKPRTDTGKDISISWDSLLRQTYLYQRYSLELSQAATEYHPPHSMDEKVETPFASTDGQTVFAVDLQQHTWDLPPSEVVRPPASAELGSILILVQRLGMHWREIDIARGSLRAEGNGCSISSNDVAGFGIVLSFNKSKTLRPKQIINNIHVDKVLCGIIPGCSELGVHDAEVVHDDRRGIWEKWLTRYNMDNSLTEAKRKKPYWGWTLPNDMLTLICPFLPTKNSPITRIPHPLSIDSIVGGFEYCDGTHFLLRKMKDRARDLGSRSTSVTTRPLGLMDRLTSPPLEADFYHRAAAARHKDLLTPLTSFGTDAAETDRLTQLKAQKLLVLDELRSVHDLTTTYFKFLRTHSDEWNPSDKALIGELTPRKARLEYLDLVRAHMDMHAHAILGMEKVEREQQPLLQELRSMIKEGYKSGKQIDPPLVAMISQFEPGKIVERLRKKYPKAEIGDDELEEAWWMLIVRGISWKMSVEFEVAGYCTTAPASLYGSDMPIWLT